MKVVISLISNELKNNSEESLSEAQIDQIIEIDRRKEKLATLRLQPKPVQSRTGNHFSRIPVLTHGTKKEQPTVETILGDIRNEF